MKANSSGIRVMTTLAVAAALCLAASATVSATTNVDTRAKQCTVPKVVGLSAQAARDELRKNGCTGRIVTKVCSMESLEKFGLIIKQTPKPGPYARNGLVTLWSVAQPGAGIKKCGGGAQSAVNTYDGIYEYTATEGSRTCTETYTNGQRPKTTTYNISPFMVGFRPAFMVKDGAFFGGIPFEGTVGANGRAEVISHLGFSQWADPPGVVTFAKNASGRIVAMGEFAANNVTTHEDSVYRTVCSVRYSFFADRYEAPS